MANGPRQRLGACLSKENEAEPSSKNRPVLRGCGQSQGLGDEKNIRRGYCTSSRMIKASMGFEKHIQVGKGVRSRSSCSSPGTRKPLTHSRQLLGQGGFTHLARGLVWPQQGQRSAAMTLIESIALKHAAIFNNNIKITRKFIPPRPP